MNRSNGGSVYVARNSIVGDSKEIVSLRNVVTEAALSGMNVLVSGETGSGKELVAYEIYAVSKKLGKRTGKYIPVNCAAIPKDLLESELFGYRKGAFTGAASTGNPGVFQTASGGTVFLDEILDMAPEHQAKLLRLFQEKEVAVVGDPEGSQVYVQIISATNKNVEYELRTGTLRKDLYFRLNGFRIDVPPLRARKSDISLLAKYFIEKYNKTGVTIYGVSREVMDLFIKHSWPGNVRELENYIGRAMAQLNREIKEGKTPSSNLGISYFPGFVPETGEPAKAAGGRRNLDAIARGNGAGSMQFIDDSSVIVTLSLPPFSSRPSLKDIKDIGGQEAERVYIERTLQEVNWNRAKAARILKISYKSFITKAVALGLGRGTSPSERISDEELADFRRIGIKDGRANYDDEKTMIERLMIYTGWNASAAARLLGVDVNRLEARIDHYHLVKLT